MATSEERIGRVLKITQLLQSMVDDGAVDNVDVALFATATMHRITGDISDEIICGDYETLLGFPNLSDSQGAAVSSLYATADYLKRGLIDCVHAEMAYVDVLLTDDGAGHNWGNQQHEMIGMLKRAIGYIAQGEFGDALYPLLATQDILEGNAPRAQADVGFDDSPEAAAYIESLCKPELPPLPHVTTALTLPPLPAAAGGRLDELAAMVNMERGADDDDEFRGRIRTRLDGFVQEQHIQRVMPPLPSLGGGDQFLDSLTVTHNLPPLPDTSQKE